MLHRSELWSNLGLKAAVVVGLGGSGGSKTVWGSPKAAIFVRIVVF